MILFLGQTSRAGIKDQNIVNDEQNQGEICRGKESNENLGICKSSKYTINAARSYPYARHLGWAEVEVDLTMPLHNSMRDNSTWCTK